MGAEQKGNTFYVKTCVEIKCRLEWSSEHHKDKRDSEPALMQLLIDSIARNYFHFYAFQSYCTLKMYKYLREKSVKLFSEGKRHKFIAVDAKNNYCEGVNPR